MRNALELNPFEYRVANPYVMFFNYNLFVKKVYLNLL